MTYQELKKLCEGKHLPISGKNVDGENVIIAHGKDQERSFYKLTTAQHNGWTRINFVYEDETHEELYKKGV